MRNFKQVDNANEMLKGINNKVKLDNDNTYHFVLSNWMEICTSEARVKSNDESVGSVKYLELIVLCAKGLSFKVKVVTEKSDMNQKCNLVGGL